MKEFSVITIYFDDVYTLKEISFLL